VVKSKVPRYSNGLAIRLADLGGLYLGVTFLESNWLRWGLSVGKGRGKVGYYTSVSRALQLLAEKRLQDVKVG
jgi:hypothetical protein